MCSKICEEKSKGSRGGKRKDQLKRFGTSSRCLGITRHPCDKTHALFVRQSSVAEGCVKMGRRMWKSDVSRSARHGHFTGSNRSMVSYEDRKLLWNSRVWKAIRRGSAEKEVRSWTGAWKQISKQRRRVYVSYDPSMVTALWHGIRMDEESFKKHVSKKRKKREAPIRLCTAHVNGLYC